MWVYSCFEGDDDEALQWAQHDLYRGMSLPPEECIGYRSTLGWWWSLVVNWAEGDRADVPWFERHFERMRALNGFNHKLLQLPHEHLAAYYRWSVRDQPRPDWRVTEPDRYRLECVRAWRRFVGQELAELMKNREAHLAVAQIIVYRHFDASERAAKRLDEILMERYGMACVAETWRAEQARLVEIERRRSTRPATVDRVREVMA